MTAIRVVTDHIELDNVGVNTHADIDSFIANSPLPIASSFDEVIKTQCNTSKVITWDSPSRVRKITEIDVTRSGGKVSQVTTLQFDTLGVEKYRVVETLTRNSVGRITSIDRVCTP